MLAHVYLKQGCVVPKHSHENEQFTYILEGALRFLVGDEADEIVVRAGRCCTCRRTCRTRRTRWRTRSTWTSSTRRARIGSTRRTTTYGGGSPPPPPPPSSWG